MHFMSLIFEGDKDSKRSIRRTRGIVEGTLTKEQTVWGLLSNIMSTLTSNQLFPRFLRFRA